MSLLAPAHPFTGTFRTDPVHSSVQLQIEHMGVGAFRTGFDAVDGELTSEDGNTRLFASIPAESISIHRPKEFRAHVLAPDFLDAAAHPDITFASEDITFLDGGRVEVNGQLTLRGVTAPVTATGTFRAPIEDPYGNQRGAIDLVTTVDRRDWGIDFQGTLPGGGNVLDWYVRVSIHTELVAG